ncbi:MAG TPA: ParA family protein, partial [Candidatus Omnitrophota bacterium]|nr:ParA family protein [Candidatus Omnitrophota bacterium]
MERERVSGPPVVAVFNHKGGVAKTTTAANLAVCLAAHGYRVVLVDFDAQGNATGGFGHLPLPPVGAYDVVTGRASLDQALLDTPFAGLKLLPATAQLRTAEQELAAHERSHAHLRDRLAEHGLERFADIAVIDCPPALGTMTVNALAAAAAVLIPARPDPYTHEGLVNTWYEVKRLRETANAALSVAGIVLTMTESEGAAADVARTIRAEFGDRVYGVEIAADPKVAEAAQLSIPVAVLDPDGLAGRAYFDTCAELLARLRRQGRPETALPEPQGRDCALNTLRDWRAGQLAL